MTLTCHAGHRERSGVDRVVACGLMPVVLGLLGLFSVAAQAQEIVVGQTLPLTGAHAVYGRDVGRGRQACVDQINLDGGIQGRSLKLLTLDDGGRPADALIAARQMVERDGAVALLGSVGLEVISEVLPWASGIGVAVIGPIAGDVGSRRVKAWSSAFFLTANLSAEAIRLVEHLTAVGGHRIVVIQQADAFGVSALATFEEALSIAGTPHMGVITLQKSGQDAESAAARVVALNPQAVFLATEEPATSAAIRAIDKARGGAHLALYGLSMSTTAENLAALGKASRGFAMTQVLPPVTETRLAIQRFFLAAMRRAGLVPSYASFEGCLAPMALAEVLKRRGNEPSRQGTLKALQKAGTVQLGGFEIDFADRERQGARFTEIVSFGSDGRTLR